MLNATILSQRLEVDPGVLIQVKATGNTIYIQTICPCIWVITFSFRPCHLPTSLCFAINDENHISTKICFATLEVGRNKCTVKRYFIVRNNNSRYSRRYAHVRMIVACENYSS